jgi:anti-anti-sigma regulatory factor
MSTVNAGPATLKQEKNSPVHRVRVDLMKVCVIDGMGGGIGNALIKKIKAAFQEEVEIIALGTNAIATAQMMKAGANKGASGENAVIVTVGNVDVIVGSISILLANSMMGEMTPGMAAAVASSPALKLILPLTQEAVEVIGVSPEPLPHLVDHLVEKRLRSLVETSLKGNK